MAEEKTERAIRELLRGDRSLAQRVIGKLRRKRAKVRNDAAVEEITRINNGYFILPRKEEVPDRLPAEGPEQLRLDLGRRS